MTRTAQPDTEPSARHTMPTPQAEEIRVAETLLGGLEIRTGAAFVIDGGIDVARLAAAWARCGDRLSRDADGRRLFEVEPLAPPGEPVPRSVRVSRDRTALAEPTRAALFSRLHRLTDGTTVWSVFVHHAVLDGNGLVFHMSVVRQAYLRSLDPEYTGDTDRMWPYATWEDSWQLAAAMFERREKTEARVLDRVDDSTRGAPVLVGPRRRASGVPRVARLGQVRPAAVRGADQAPDGPPDPKASLAWLCGYTAVLLFAATGEPAVQLSVPRSGVSRATRTQPLGSFAYTLPLAVPHPGGATLAEFLDTIAADIRDNRWSQCHRSTSLRRSYGPNVNLFPVDLFAGEDTLGARWTYELISSGPVEDVDIVCAFVGTSLDVSAQIGMTGLNAADFRRVEHALRAVLEDFAAADPATPAADLLTRARAHLAPLTALNRELASGPSAAAPAGGPSDETAVRAAVAEVLRARYGRTTDPRTYDFFESGDSSLEAVTLVTEISDALGVPLDPATLFYHPTFDELVASVAAAAAPGDDRATGWRTAGFFDIGPGPAPAPDGLLTGLLTRVAAAWGAPGPGTDGPAPTATDRAAELVTSTDTTGPLSLRAEHPPGSTAVRLTVRTRRAVTETDARATVTRAAAATGLGPVTHSVFGEVLTA